MTHVHFEYSDAYGSGSRGSLAFTPHRRHAANETEVLPKPFTVPLLNGEVTVDLKPNPSTWVWIVTEYFEQNAESFYTTIPDSDGVIEAVDLTRINPSTIPAPYNAVEPVWWAEMRQYKQTVTNTLLQSEEALTEAKAAIDIGKDSIERTQHNASLAKAYAEESREDSYASREYRDEAEQWRNEAKEQADRAASGPESAAARAETAAQASEDNEVATRGYRDEARNSAAEARSSETSANGSASTATERASDARNEANRSESEANRAKGYADELMEGPREYVTQAEAARDLSQSYRDEAQGHADTASQHVLQAQQHATNSQTASGQSQESADLSASHAVSSQEYAQQAQSAVDSIANHGEWVEVELLSGFTHHSSSTVRVRRMSTGLFQMIGRFNEGTRSNGTVFAQLPEGYEPSELQRLIAVEGENTVLFSASSTGTLTIRSDIGDGAGYIHAFYI